MQKPRKTIEDYAPFVEKLDYNPHTGVFTWKAGGRRRRRSGVAGTITKLGYVAIGTGGKLVLAHRLAWVMTYGELPEDIDHINRNRSDNRIANLRSVSHSENMRNKGTNYRFKKKTSCSNPEHGVIKKKSGWGLSLHFSTLEGAMEARRAVEHLVPIPRREK